MSKKRNNIIPSLCENTASVSPSDSTDLSYDCLLYVGGAGNVKLTSADGTTVTMIGLRAGTILPIVCRRIWSTDTTARNLVAMW